MRKVVMSVGQCLHNHMKIAKLIHFLGAEIEKVDIAEIAIKELKENIDKCTCSCE